MPRPHLVTVVLGSSLLPVQVPTNSPSLMICDQYFGDSSTEHILCPHCYDNRLSKRWPETAVFCPYHKYRLLPRNLPDPRSITTPGHASIDGTAIQCTVHSFIQFISVAQFLHRRQCLQDRTHSHLTTVVTANMDSTLGMLLKLSGWLYNSLSGRKTLETVGRMQIEIAKKTFLTDFVQKYHRLLIRCQIIKDPC